MAESLSLWPEIRRLMQHCKEAVGDLRRAGLELADNDAAYREAVAIATLEFRDRGVPVTIIGDLVRGKEDVSALRSARDRSQVMYDTIQEDINVSKRNLSILNAQYEREWHG